jgi:hypothetical protein
MDFYVNMCPLFTRVAARVVVCLHRSWRYSVRVATRPGRHDLVSSLLVTASLLAPLWARPVAAQVGTSAAEQVLCGEGINTAQWISIGLGLISAFYIFKFLLRVMLGLDIIHRTEHIGQDGIRRTDATPRQGKKKARGGIYSLVAALLPVFVPALLTVAGINVVSCLFP